VGRLIDDSGAETEATNSITFKPWHRTVAVPGLCAFPDDHGREPQSGRKKCSKRSERRPATYIGSETLLLPSYHRHLRNIGKKRIAVVSVDHSTEVDITRQTPSFSCFCFDCRYALGARNRGVQIQSPRHAGKNGLSRVNATSRFLLQGKDLRLNLGSIQQVSMATDFGKSRRHVVASYWQQRYCRVQIPLPVSPRITSAFCHWVWQANRCSMDCLTIAGPRCAIRLRASRLSTSHASRAVRSKFRQAPRPWAGKDA